MSHFDDNEDDIIFGRSPGLRREPRHTAVKCPNCGEGGLEWTSAGASAYLYKPGRGRHICHVRVLNDFEDLDQ